MLGLALNLRNVAIAMAIAFAAGGLASNTVTRWYYRAEIAAGEAHAAHTDTKAADQLNESAGKTAAEIAADDASNTTVTRDIEADAAKQPVAARRVLTAVDVRRLRAIR